MSRISTKIFADGADLGVIEKLCKNPLICGFTTNPTLMRKAGITDYEAFAHAALKLVGDRPISFEVFSDEFGEMERQARRIATWGSNVYVKIPVTNTRREPADELVQRLSQAGVKVNVTAVLTRSGQTFRLPREWCAEHHLDLRRRIADTGVDPVPLMRTIDLCVLAPRSRSSGKSRELLNAVQAGDIGCHIITVTADILAKLSMFAATSKLIARNREDVYVTPPRQNSVADVRRDAASV